MGLKSFCKDVKIRESMPNGHSWPLQSNPDPAHVIRFDAKLAYVRNRYTFKDCPGHLRDFRAESSSLRWTRRLIAETQRLCPSRQRIF